MAIRNRAAHSWESELIPAGKKRKSRAKPKPPPPEPNFVVGQEADLDCLPRVRVIILEIRRSDHTALVTYPEGEFEGLEDWYPWKDLIPVPPSRQQHRDWLTEG